MSKEPQFSDDMEDFKPGSWDSSFSGFEPALPEGSWERLQQRRRKRRFLPFWWWTFGAMGLLLVSLGIWKFSGGNSNKSEIASGKNVESTLPTENSPSNLEGRVGESRVIKTEKQTAEKASERTSQQTEAGNAQPAETGTQPVSEVPKTENPSGRVIHVPSTEIAKNRLLAGTLPVRKLAGKRKARPEGSRNRTDNSKWVKSPLFVQSPLVEKGSAQPVENSSNAENVPILENESGGGSGKNSENQPGNPSETNLQEKAGNSSATIPVASAATKPDTTPALVHQPIIDSSHVASKDSSTKTEKLVRFYMEAGVLGFSLNQQFQDNPGSASDKSRTSLQSVDPGLGLSLQCRGVLNLGNRWQLVPALQLGATMIRSVWQTGPGPLAEVRLVQVGNEILGSPVQQQTMNRKTRTLAFAGPGMEIGYRFTNRFTARTGLRHTFWLPISDGDTKPEENLPSVLLAFHYQLNRRISVRSEAVWGKGKRFLAGLEAPVQNLQLGFGLSVRL